MWVYETIQVETKELSFDDLMFCLKENLVDWQVVQDLIIIRKLNEYLSNHPTIRLLHNKSNMYHWKDEAKTFVRFVNFFKSNCDSKFMILNNDDLLEKNFEKFLLKYDIFYHELFHSQKRSLFVIFCADQMFETFIPTHEFICQMEINDE